MLVGDCMLPLRQHGREIIFPVLSHGRSPVKLRRPGREELAEPSVLSRLLGSHVIRSECWPWSLTDTRPVQPTLLYRSKSVGKILRNHLRWIQRMVAYRL